MDNGTHGFARLGGGGPAMKPGNALSGFTRMFPLEMACVLFSRRARRTVYGLVVLRRTHEYVLVMAALEGTQEDRRAYYEGYVDALEILGAKALLLAKAL
jgi:hypothetical protein